MPSRTLPMLPPDVAWQAPAADLQVDTAGPGIGLSGTKTALNATAEGHFGAPLALGDFTDLCLTVSGDPPAGPGSADPFYLELRLGSAALAPGDAANTWQRLLPLPSAPTAISVSLTDLPAAARSAMDRIRFTCIRSGQAFSCRLDGLLVLRESMLTDLDAGLAALLDGALAGTGVAVVFDPPAEGTAALLLQQVAVRRAAERDRLVAQRTDYSGSGFRLRPGRSAYDIDYWLTFRGVDRAVQAEALDAVLGALAPGTRIDVAGLPVPIDLVPLAPLGELLRALPTHVGELVLAITARTSRPIAGASTEAVPPYAGVDVITGYGTDEP